MSNHSNVETLNRLATEGLIRARTDAFESLTPTPGHRAWDRVEGMMLGLAIGDALGNASEAQNPTTRTAERGTIRDYLPNRHARGRAVGLPSDDTQLAFWAIEQMLTDGCYVPEHLARTFTMRRILGIGSTVREFVRNHRDAGLPWWRGGVASAGNGALMRIAPSVIPHLRAPSTALWADVALSTMTTHNDSAAIASSVAFVAQLWDLLAMERPPQPEWWSRRFCEVAALVETADAYSPRGGDFTRFRGRLSDYVRVRLADAGERGASTLDACNSWHSGAFLFETVPAALYILTRHAADPEEAIVRAVNDTRDNDTVAAIVGAAVGALHGAEAIPERWRRGLLGRTAEDDDGRVFELLAAARAQFAQETMGVR